MRNQPIIVKSQNIETHRQQCKWSSSYNRISSDSKKHCIGIALQYWNNDLPLLVRLCFSELRLLWRTCRRLEIWFCSFSIALSKRYCVLGNFICSEMVKQTKLKWPKITYKKWNKIVTCEEFGSTSSLVQVTAKCDICICM